jgi:hypothetical protein
LYLNLSNYENISTPFFLTSLAAATTTAATDSAERERCRPTAESPANAAQSELWSPNDAQSANAAKPDAATAKSDDDDVERTKQSHGESNANRWHGQPERSAPAGRKFFIISLYYFEW